MKVAFIQIKGGNYGGVWQVNRLVGEALINEGYDVSVVSIRDDYEVENLPHDDRLKLVTINKRDIWHTYHGDDFRKSLKSHHYWTLIKQLCHRLRNEWRLKVDANNLKKYLNKEKPDYLVLSHYQLLDMIPKNYLQKTLCEQHTSFFDTKSNPANMKIFYKYNNRIKKYIWLTKKSMEYAIDAGLTNSTYIYNAVRFESDRVSDVCHNKKLVSISRISAQKRIDRMIKIVEKVFEDKKYHDWKLEIYGDGEDFDDIKKLIHSPQIKMMGKTSSPKDVMLSASIDLNTSDYEGFCLTIIEGYECGVPIISFNCGEQIEEVIENNKTGFICESEEEYINKLKKLMDNDNLLKEMSITCKKYNERFHMNRIIKEWKKIFEEKEV